MENSGSLGATVRERRLALGYSLGQLATRVDKTAASIRAWEKGDSIPEAEDMAALAEALDLDPAALRALAPAPARPAFEPRHLHPVQITDPWAAVRAKLAAAEVDTPVAPAPAVVAIAAVADDAAPDAEPDDVVGGEPVSVPSPEARRAAIEDAMTEAVPVVAGTGVVVEPVDGGTAAPVADRMDNPATWAWDIAVGWYRRIFDPDRPWIYRIRFVLLLIAFYVMLRILGWAVSELWAAIQEVLDSISFTPTETPDVTN